MSEEKKPSTKYYLSMAMYDSLDDAKSWVPKAEWYDLKEYVEKSAYDHALKRIERLRTALEEISKNRCYDCSCGNCASDALQEYEKGE